ncbi:hypothetical protein BABINDRAFT_159810 [Babjeviella inositovora NRRL Y-12698]|uniref:NADP-dependent oxidoreductase domain-containing protein n=1 Tax=Babjeviella inositovora NRRL Y-12698 TaxID=984486 RepID=A0A1E3QWT0_9ASCO|nr:uncharacterized protein BABINDRAFT_159810 [Babjeviella inositovora NRRL Y-12698]ODQ81532.1 hypothetical protein BABINDRAFT_159810 [Babjeviella inositovora NRRL Y-12698]
MPSALVKPVGPSKPSSKDLSQLPPIIFGGAIFNTQYNDDPDAMPCAEMVRLTFRKGCYAIDTSPYYGNSESILGNALVEVADEFPRDLYFICTKAGRIRLDEFDYSPSAIRASVLRSCERLHTSYLDQVYCHDIEFVPVAEVLEALKELKRLKQEGVIRNFGFSGYPLDHLIRVAEICAKDKDIGPVDAILSYCNGCIQNTSFFDYGLAQLKALGTMNICNGSILSMSLLRSQDTKSFHPGDKQLKAKAKEIGAWLLKDYNVELAELATRYAIRSILGKGFTVIGVSNIAELEAAIASYHIVNDPANEINMQDAVLVAKVQAAFGSHMNETWASGLESFDYNV